jgi:integrase
MPRQNNGPHLKLNDRGLYEVRWTENRRSKRVSTGTGNLQEATAFLSSYIKESAAVEAEVTAAAGTVKIGEILDLYLADHVEAGDVADKVRQRNIARCLRPYFGDLTPGDITVKVVGEYRRQRAAGEVGLRRAPSPSTHRRELNMLVAAFNYAVKVKFKKLLATDVPFIPLPEESAPRQFWLNELEERQYLAAANKCSARGRLFVHIALGTASRRKAIETLTWEQVDMAAGMIHFNPPGRVQTNKRRVPIAISDALWEVLAETPDDMRKGYVLEHPGSIDRALQTVNRAAFKETGNARFMNVTPHVLRHTWATLAARKGLEMYEIAGVLGDTIATVTKTYLHHCPEHLRRAVNFRDTERA